MDLHKYFSRFWWPLDFENSKKRQSPWNWMWFILALTQSWCTNLKIGIDMLKYPSFIHFQIVSSQVAHMPHDCVNAKINHIQFHGDRLFFEFSKSKGHKKREKYLCRSIKKCGCVQCSHYRGICFAILMYWRVMQLFEGKSQYTQYATRLTKLSKQDI